MHVDGVLLQVEAVGEGLETVGADAGLHALPAVPRVTGGTVLFYSNFI